MRILWLWMKIWHGFISGNIFLIEISIPGKLDAFIEKRTVLSLNSWTITGETLLGTSQDHSSSLDSEISHNKYLLEPVPQHFPFVFPMVDHG